MKDWHILLIVGIIITIVFLFIFDFIDDMADKGCKEQYGQNATYIVKNRLCMLENGELRGLR